MCLPSHVPQGVLAYRFGLLRSAVTSPIKRFIMHVNVTFARQAVLPIVETNAVRKFYEEHLTAHTVWTMSIHVPDAPQVRAELAPWEKQMQEVQAKMDVATSERDVLLKKHTDAEARLQAAVEALAAAKQGATGKDKEIVGIQKSMEACRWVGMA